MMNNYPAPTFSKSMYLFRLNLRKKNIQLHVSFKSTKKIEICFISKSAYFYTIENITVSLFSENCSQFILFDSIVSIL